MAAFAILFSLWSLVLSQDSKACVGDQCELKSGSEDETALVQVNVGQSSVKSDLLPAPVLADEGQSCTSKCGGPDACSVSGTAAITRSTLNTFAVELSTMVCVDPPLSIGDGWGAPVIIWVDNGQAGPQCITRSSGSSQTCSEPPTSAAQVNLQNSPFPVHIRRVCQCLTSLPASAENTGDPHIRTFRGAHYTLLQQGVFVAWNLSKSVPAPSAARAEWQLLAAYAGERFTTQGLLLLDPHAGAMEITAEDCTWRVKEEKTPWRQAHLEQISAENGETSLQVKKLHEKLGETKMLRSAIVLQMGSGSHGIKRIASLVAHCSPQNHLDFKVTMFDRKDVQYVGGELGVAPDGNHSYNFFSKKSMVQMRADQEFKAPGSWVTLGGSPAGAAYLEKQHTAASLMQSQSCSDAEEESARSVCSKHLDEETHPETFSDCLFDLCHGGDESFAQSAAAFLMPLDDSSA